MDIGDKGSRAGDTAPDGLLEDPTFDSPRDLGLNGKCLGTKPARFSSCTVALGAFGEVTGLGDLKAPAPDFLACIAAIAAETFLLEGADRKVEALAPGDADTRCCPLFGETSGEALGELLRAGDTPRRYVGVDVKFGDRIAFGA